MRNELIAALGGWLFTYLLHSTLLLGATWFACRRLIQTPAVRELLWKTALVGGLVTATVQAALGFEPLGGAMALAPANGDITTGTASGVWRGFLQEPVSAAPAQAEETGPAVAAGAVAAVPTGPASSEPATQPAVDPWRLPDLLTLAVGGWLVIAAALSLRYLIQRQRAMRRIGPRRAVGDERLQRMLATLCRSGGVRHPVRLTAAAGLSSPVALGRAEIVLPEAALTDLDLDQQRGMLAHELAHLVRRDPWWLAAACVIERVCFLQPLNRLARRRMQEAAEFLCDDWAVQSTGSGFFLASCLVKVAEWVDTRPRPVPMAGMAEHRSQLVTRIHRLIEGRTMQTTPRSLWFAAGAVALLGITAVAAPGVTPAHQPLAEEAQATPGSDQTVDAAGRLDLAAIPSDTDTVVAAPAESSELEASARSLRALEKALSRTQRQSMRTAAIDAKRAAALEARLMVPRPPQVPLPARAPRAWAATLPGVHWGEERQRDTTGIAVPALVAALRDSDVEVRRAAARSLANIADRRAVLGLIDALKDSDAEVRAYSVMALGEVRDERAIPGLVAALKDNSTEVRQHALNALEEMPGKVPDDAVLSALADPNEDVRQAALSFAMSRMSHEDDDGNVVADPRYVNAFVKLLGDPSADVRQEAVSALGSAGLKQAPAALFPLARDRSPDVRQAVAQTLGEIGDPRGVPTLKELLQDGNADVREAAVDGLGELRDQSALEALVGALKSSDPEVRRAAASALGQRGD